MITKEIVKKVLEAKDILDSNICKNGMDIEDLLEEDYVMDLCNIINNEGYKNELIEDNKG